MKYKHKVDVVVSLLLMVAVFGLGLAVGRHYPTDSHRLSTAYTSKRLADISKKFEYVNYEQTIHKQGSTKYSLYLSDGDTALAYRDAKALEYLESIPVIAPSEPSTNPAPVDYSVFILDGGHNGK
jgi:glutamine cyclotransferase